MATRLSRRPSRRKQKKRSQNCGANIRALVPSTGKREGRKFGRHWRLSKRFLLVLLRYKLLRARFRAVPPQHGHRGNRLTIAAMRLRRMVAIEFGMCRSGRKGGSSGSVTVGYGKLREQRGGTRS